MSCDDGGFGWRESGGEAGKVQCGGRGCTTMVADDPEIEGAIYCEPCRTLAKEDDAAQACLYIRALADYQLRAKRAQEVLRAFNQAETAAREAQERLEKARSAAKLEVIETAQAGGLLSIDAGWIGHWLINECRLGHDAIRRLPGGRKWLASAYASPNK